MTVALLVEVSLYYVFGTIIEVRMKLHRHLYSVHQQDFQSPLSLVPSNGQW